MKIACIFMPNNEVRPPASSTGSTAGDLIMDEIARRLALSHEVIAYCLRGEGQQQVERFEGVEYRRFSIPVDKWFLQHHRKILYLTALLSRGPQQPLANSALWYRQFITKIIADPALRNCDVIHIMNLSQFIPILRARLPKTRIVLHMESQWLEHLDRAAIERRIKAADLILGCSDFIAKGVRQRFPALAQRCSHIFNGTDVALLTRPPGLKPSPKKVLFVGRLAPEKGVHVLLDAFRIVLEQQPDAQLELIGPESVIPREILWPTCNDPHVLEIEPYFRAGVYSQLLRAKVAEFPPGSVSFLNRATKSKDLVPHYHSASIFVFPSVCEEAFGMPVVEAMASRTPVVTTRGGASPEIVEHGRSGLLVERSGVQGLAEAMLQLLANPERREAMAQAAFERASNVFSWDRIAEDLLEKYERLFECSKQQANPETQPGRATPGSWRRFIAHNSGIHL
jgi:glycosyltransferase involved in cell wall biosynthesis